MGAPPREGLSRAPYFEDLRPGLLERSAPAVTLTEGMAAVHQAIVGDRLRLALDRTLAREVLGSSTALAHPALVWDVAIGQSTLLTARVIANLFYRGLVLKRFPLIGDTLHTTTEVIALRQTRTRPDRPASGLAVLRVRTVDEAGRAVLDFSRCAMLPLRDPAGSTAAQDSFDELPAELDPASLHAPVSSWRLAALADGTGLEQLTAGMRWSCESGDVVSAAPELARLTLNVAAVHHDSHSQPAGRRLVYGGHTIGIAAAQATRLLPQIATIIGWHSCEHLAPVAEGDTLRSSLELERLERIAQGGALAHLRSRVLARGEQGPREEVAVLDWRFVALLV
jgi:acyl dehydratase